MPTEYTIRSMTQFSNTKYITKTLFTKIEILIYFKKGKRKTT